jgi:hypothetical protein
MVERGGAMNVRSLVLGTVVGVIITAAVAVAQASTGDSGTASSRLSHVAFAHFYPNGGGVEPRHTSRNVAAVSQGNGRWCLWVPFRVKTGSATLDVGYGSSGRTATLLLRGSGEGVGTILTTPGNPCYGASAVVDVENANMGFYAQLEG